MSKKKDLENLLRCNSLSYRYITQGTHNSEWTVDSVSFDLKKSRIYGLVGENGSGKTTLLRLLNSSLEIQEGTIEIEGIQEGKNFFCLHMPQHLTIPKELRLWEAFLLLNPEVKSTRLIPAKKKWLAWSQNLNNSFGIKLSWDQKIGDISYHELSKLYCAVAFAKIPDLFILDEPTINSTPKESEELFQLLKKIKEQGSTIIMVTHRMDEISEICEEVLFMRQGKLVHAVNREEIPQILDSFFHKTKYKIQRSKGPLKESINGNSYTGEKASIEKIRVFSKHNALELQESQIVGITGIAESGLSNLEMDICQEDDDSQYYVQINNGQLLPLNLKTMREEQITLIPSNRMLRGVALNLNIHDNLVLAHLDTVFPQGFYSQKASHKLAYDVMNMKHDILHHPIESLSGGTIQRLIINRELLKPTRALIVFEPGSGLDPSQRSYLISRLEQLRKAGIPILLVSSDLDEVLSLCDPIFVMHRGLIEKFESEGEKDPRSQLSKMMINYKNQSGSRK